MLESLRMVVGTGFHGQKNIVSPTKKDLNSLFGTIKVHYAVLLSVKLLMLSLNQYNLVVWSDNLMKFILLSFTHMR